MNVISQILSYFGRQIEKLVENKVLRLFKTTKPTCDNAESVFLKVTFGIFFTFKFFLFVQKLYWNFFPLLKKIKFIFIIN